MKNKAETTEDFIGWKSEDGLLEVTEIYEKRRTNKIFKVICHKCKEDKELFPLGYFTSTKGHLLAKKKPCGCSKIPKWNKNQFLVLARRAGEGRFIIHGFAEEFHGQKTKLNLECLVDGHKWTARLSCIMNNNSGCPACGVKSVATARRTNQLVAFTKCKTICEAEGYEPIGFVGGYKNSKSRFEYVCPKHKIQNVSYDKFVNSANRCSKCYKEEIRFNGYYPERKDEVDFLYVLNFNENYIKVGRSFNVDERLLKLKSLSNIENIIKLRIFTATHQEVYDTEQALLEELRERGFQYNLSWTKECFENECLYSLNKLLDICGLQELPIE